MDYFKDQNMKNKLLQIIFNTLVSSRPTSIESERAFSIATSLHTKIKSLYRISNMIVQAFLMRNVQVVYLIND